MNFRLLTYVRSNLPMAGLLLDDNTVVDAVALLGGSIHMAVEDILEDWAETSARIAERIEGGLDGIPRWPLAGLQLGAPLHRGQIYVAGSNYRDHIEEMLKRDLASGVERAATHLEKPYHSLKVSRACLVGTGARVKAPDGCNKFDWEAELAVIIGRKADHVSAENALDYVAGYAVANDLSARDLGRRKDAERGTTFWVDWIGHKSFAGACPLGPWITPSALVPDPQALSIKLWVNGELRQDSHTSNMIFSVAEQIAYLSGRLPLYPGDVILTGTPSGTAASWNNAYLKGGEEIKIEIDRLGQLITHVA